MHAASATPLAHTPLRERWLGLRTQRPHLRARDGARELGVTELELLATHCGDTVTRLAGDFSDILKEVATLGRVMALTRNEYCVHERKGLYRNLSFRGGMGLALGEEIDLRLFMRQWAHGFAVEEPGREGDVRRSLQFFDAHGDAVHKVHLLPQSDAAAFSALIDRFAAEDQSTWVEIEARPASQPETPDALIDAAGLMAGWDALRDVHDFHDLLKRFGVSRTQALRLAGPARAPRTANTAHSTLLEAARDAALPIMVFVGNAGCIQIHTGEVLNLKRVDGWYNVLDSDFNLHLFEAGIAHSHIVRKPTVDGIITSVELFDAQGLPVAAFFGKRKPGHPENPAWREIVATLPTGMDTGA